MEDAINLLQREADRLWRDGSDVARKLSYSYQRAIEVLNKQLKNI